MRWDKDYVKEAADSGKIIPGFNIFGYEDAQAVIRAAEKAGSPVILMINKSAREALDIQSWARLLLSLGQRADVPVGIHLDHCSDLNLIRQAVDSGFTSVMYDGSMLPFDENRKFTQQMAEYAHSYGVFLEGELGQVPYSDLGQTEIRYTSPEEAAGMFMKTDVDWLAVSVGNIHRLTEGTAAINYSVLKKIQEVCRLPLVIHGSSGISEKDIAKLKREKIGKMNFGTILRKTFSDVLRQEMKRYPEEFDRLKLFESPIKRVEQEAYWIISKLQKEEKDENSAERTI
ncbi:MAG: class II fructose-bisphosphate aldolase [Ruminococcus sp.]|jgi:fructose-bisphosphate aldolase class II